MNNQNKTAIQIRWRREVYSAECLAIIYALDSTFNTREELLHVLPQFSKNRLEVALESLFIYQLVSQQVDQLILSPDARRIDELTMQPDLILPVSTGDVTLSFMLKLLGKLGFENPGIALGAIYFNSTSADVCLVGEKHE